MVRGNSYFYSVEYGSLLLCGAFCSQVSSICRFVVEGRVSLHKTLPRELSFYKVFSGARRTAPGPCNCSPIPRKGISQKWSDCHHYAASTDCGRLQRSTIGFEHSLRHTKDEVASVLLCKFL